MHSVVTLNGDTQFHRDGWDNVCLFEILVLLMTVHLLILSAFRIHPLHDVAYLYPRETLRF